MLAITEGQASWIRRHVLRLALEGRVRLAQLAEAPRIEFFRVRVQLGVHADGVSRETDLRIGWDDEAVGERPVLGDYALKGNCVRQYGQWMLDWRVLLGGRRT